MGNNMDRPNGALSKNGTINECNTKSSEDDERLLDWSQLEPWMQDNEYLLTGYRRATYSFLRSIRSILRLHNDTINIWSHLIGALQFAGYIYYLYTTWPKFPYQKYTDGLAIAGYELSVVNCFVSSFLFHTFANHSKEVHLRGNELDHLGIVGVLYGTGLAATHFEFYDRPQLRNAYWTVSTMFAIASAIFSLKAKFRTPEYRPVRVYAHSLLGLSCFIPMIQGLWVYGYEALDKRMSFSHFIGLALCQSSAALIYGVRIPERWFPQKFDIFGASHQIMHIFVIFGAMVYDRGLYKAMEWWNTNENSKR